MEQLWNLTVPILYSVEELYMLAEGNKGDSEDTDEYEPIKQVVKKKVKKLRPSRPLGNKNNSDVKKGAGADNLKEETEKKVTLRMGLGRPSLLQQIKPEPLDETFGNKLIDIVQKIKQEALDVDESLTKGNKTIEEIDLSSPKISSRSRVSKRPNVRPSGRKGKISEGIDLPPTVKVTLVKEEVTTETRKVDPRTSKVPSFVEDHQKSSDRKPIVDDIKIKDSNLTKNEQVARLVERLRSELDEKDKVSKGQQRLIEDLKQQFLIIKNDNQIKSKETLKLTGKCKSMEKELLSLAETKDNHKELLKTVDELRDKLDSKSETESEDNMLMLKMQGINNDLEQKNINLLVQNNELDKKNVNLLGINNDLEQKDSTLVEELEEKNNKITKITSDITLLTIKVKEIDKVSDAKTLKIEKIEKDIEKLKEKHKEDIVKLKEKHKDNEKKQENKSKENQNVKKELTAKRKELSVLNTLVEEKSSDVRRKQMEIDQKNKEIEELTCKVNENEMRLNVEVNKSVELIKKNNFTEKMIHSKDEELLAMRGQNQVLQCNLSKADEKLARQEIDARQSTFADLHGKVKCLQDEKQDLLKEIRQVSSLQKKIKFLDAKVKKYHDFYQENNKDVSAKKLEDNLRENVLKDIAIPDPQEIDDILDQIGGSPITAHQTNQTIVNSDDQPEKITPTDNQTQLPPYPEVASAEDDTAVGDGLVSAWRSRVKQNDMFNNPDTPSEPLVKESVVEVIKNDLKKEANEESVADDIVVISINNGKDFKGKKSLRKKKTESSDSDNSDDDHKKRKKSKKSKKKKKKTKVKDSDVSDDDRYTAREKTRKSRRKSPSRSRSRSLSPRRNKSLSFSRSRSPQLRRSVSRSRSPLRKSRSPISPIHRRRNLSKRMSRTPSATPPNKTRIIKRTPLNFSTSSRRYLSPSRSLSPVRTSKSPSPLHTRLSQEIFSIMSKLKEAKTSKEVVTAAMQECEEISEDEMTLAEDCRTSETVKVDKIVASTSNDHQLVADYGDEGGDGESTNSNDDEMSTSVQMIDITKYVDLHQDPVSSDVLTKLDVLLAEDIPEISPSESITTQESVDTDRLKEVNTADVTEKSSEVYSPSKADYSDDNSDIGTDDISEVSLINKSDNLSIIPTNPNDNKGLVSVVESDKSDNPLLVFWRQNCDCCGAKVGVDSDHFVNEKEDENEEGELTIKTCKKKADWLRQGLPLICAYCSLSGDHWVSACPLLASFCFRCWCWGHVTDTHTDMTPSRLDRLVSTYNRFRLNHLANVGRSEQYKVFPINSRIVIDEGDVVWRYEGDKNQVEEVARKVPGHLGQPVDWLIQESWSTHRPDLVINPGYRMST